LQQHIFFTGTIIILFIHEQVYLPNKIQIKIQISAW